MPEIYEGNTGVYCIRNIRNGKRYVGSAAKSLIMRRRDHWNKLARGVHKNTHLQSAWNKYGPRSFVFQILERCPPKKCIEREQHWMDCLDSTNPKKGYNICPTAGSVLGYRHTEEWKSEMAERSLRRWTDPEYRRNVVSNGRKAYQRKMDTQSEEERQARLQAYKERAMRQSSDPLFRSKMSDVARRNLENPEWRRNQAEAARRRGANPEWRAKMSKVARRKAADPEWRAKMSEIAKRRCGKPLSAEHRQKLKEARARYLARKKASLNGEQT
jgi:group I intron endonuclease